MKRPHWLSRHPPACTCVQCDRARLSRLDAEAAPGQSRRSTVRSSRPRGLLRAAMEAHAVYLSCNF